MITYEQYIGPWAKSTDLTAERQANAVRLLYAVEDLMRELIAAGVRFPFNPKTLTQVSGETYGGFRPQACPIGAPRSSHKEGLAVDIYDPDNKIDEWCMVNQDRLAHFGIYIEHPSATPHWSHWTIRPPVSGHTVFYP